MESTDTSVTVEHGRKAIKQMSLGILSHFYANIQTAVKLPSFCRVAVPHLELGDSINKVDIFWSRFKALR